MTASAVEKTYQIKSGSEPLAVARAFYRADGIEIPQAFSENDQSFFEKYLRPSFEAFLADPGSTAWVPAKGTERSILIETLFDWHAAELHNPSDERLEVIMEVNGVGLVTWFAVDAEGRVQGHKDDVWKAGYGRPINDLVLAIPLSIEPGGTIQLYLGSNTFENSYWRTSIWDQRNFQENRLDSMIMDGLYFGLVATLLLFCLVVFANIREPVYLFFALFLASSALIVLIASGLYHRILPAPYTGYGAYFLFISSSALDFSASVFSILLLRLHQTKSLLYQGWLFLIVANLMNTVFLVYVFDPNAVLSPDTELPALTSSLVALLELGVYTWTVIACWRTSKIAVYWFLVIFSHSIALLIWTAFSSNPDALPLEPKSLIQLVTLFDAIMICGVLAYTYRIERDERIAAQGLSVENLRLARDIEQAKANFVSTVSHDLHGPVRAIRSFTELLHKKIAGDGQTELQRIDENVETVSNLIDSLVKFSQGDAHRQLSIEETSLAKILYTIKNEYEPVARAKGIVLSVPDSDVSIETDPVAFSQVLRNLIDNAIKYTDDGTVGVLLDDEGDRVMITVADTGKGIASENMQKIFDEFYQVSSNDSEGVGLGLSIVARLTKLLGIKLNVSSDVGFGTQFELLVPKTSRSGQAILEQSLDQEFGLVAAVYKGETDRLDQVVQLLRQWGVEIAETESESTNLLVAPGTEDGLKWAQQRDAGQWILLVGEVVGFAPPSDKFVILPAEAEPMMLRSAVQRILL